MAKQIDEQQVRHVATLSRLKLTDQEVTNLATELSAILGYVDKLSELDTSNVEPTAHIGGVHTVLRGDEPGEPLAQDDALANAPDQAKGFFKVPKVLDTESA